MPNASHLEFTGHGPVWPVGIPMCPLEISDAGHGLIAWEQIFKTSLCTRIQPMSMVKAKDWIHCPRTGFQPLIAAWSSLSVAELGPRVPLVHFRVISDALSDLTAWERSSKVYSYAGIQPMCTVKARGWISSLASCLEITGHVPVQAKTSLKEHEGIMI